MFVLANKMGLRKVLNFAICASIVVLGVTTKARADFHLSGTDTAGGGTNVEIGSDASNTLIMFSLKTVGNFTVTGTALGTNSGTFAVGDSGMDLSAVSVNSAGAGTLILYLTQSALTIPVGSASVVETITGHFITGSGSITAIGYANDTNLLYGSTGSEPGGTSPAVGPPNNVATGTVDALNGPGSSVASFFSIPPYSITEIVTIHFSTTGGSVSFDGSEVVTAPAPMSLVLCLSALPVVAMGYLVRRNRTRTRVLNVA